MPLSPTIDFPKRRPQRRVLEDQPRLELPIGPLHEISRPSNAGREDVPRKRGVVDVDFYI